MAVFNGTDLGTELSQDALHTILALVCTSIHDEVFNLLTGEEPGQRIGSAALEIFAAYALEHGTEVVQSDICLQAVVAIHHLVVLNDVLSTKSPVPAFAVSMWEQVRHLPQEEQAMVAAKVMDSLKHLIGDTGCRIVCVRDIRSAKPFTDCSAPRIWSTPPCCTPLAT